MNSFLKTKPFQEITDFQYQLKMNKKNRRISFYSIFRNIIASWNNFQENNLTL